MSDIIPVGDSPFQIAVNELTNTIYVTNIGDNNVSVIDGDTNIVTDTISVGSSPRGIAVNELTNTIYTANLSSRNVSVINGITNAVTATISLLTRAPFGIALNATTNTVYVTDISVNNDLVVINGDDNSVTTIINVGSFPFGVAVNEITNTIYVTNNADGTVSVIDGDTNTVTNTIDIGINTSPNGIAVNEATNTVYTANTVDETVSVINGVTNTVTDTITVGSVTIDVAVNELTNTIYATNSGDNTVSVIDGETNTVSGTPITVGSTPFGVAINEGTNIIYVVNNGDDTVSVITPTFGNEFQGLPEGAINSKSSSIINAINGDQLLFTGDVVVNLTTDPPNLLLPRVGVVVSSGEAGYGVVVGGNQKGVYGDEEKSSTIFEAQQQGVLAAIENDSVRICTQGVCLARVTNTTNTVLEAGTPLTPARGGVSVDTMGAFKKAIPGDPVLARLLQSSIADLSQRIMAVNIQREGIL